jgi:hypothetical protein
MADAVAAPVRVTTQPGQGDEMAMPRNASPWMKRRSEIAVFATVEAALARLDFFFALWGHSNPVLYRRIPVQIAVPDDFADFEKPRVAGRSWLSLACRAHTARYQPSSGRHVKTSRSQCARGVQAGVGPCILPSPIDSFAGPASALFLKDRVHAALAIDRRSIDRESSKRQLVLF